MGTELRVTATEAKNNLGRIIRLARRTGKPVWIENRKEPVAVVISVEAFERYRKTRGRPTEQARRAFGLWADRTDLDDAWLAQGRQHWRSRWKENG